MVGIAIIFYRLVQGRTGLVTAPLCFLGLQILFTIGLIQSVAWTDDFDVGFLGLVLAGMGLFVIGAAFANTSHGFAPQREMRAYRERATIDDTTALGRNQVLVLFAIVSVVVAIEFTRRVGYNSFQRALEQFMITGDVDRAGFSDLRVSATRDQYVAAGYAVQFTAVILPAVAMLLYFRGVSRRDGVSKLLSLGLGLISLYSVTAVGGRQYLVQIGATFLLLAGSVTSPFRRVDRPPRRVVRRAILTLVVLYGATSLLQGRLGEGGIADRGSDILGNAYNRVSGEYSGYQLQAIRALRSELPVLGSEWWNTLQTVLPGPTSGPTFDQRVHAILFSGNDRGNSPLSFFGSAYYNWGPVGVLLLSIALGFCLQTFTIRALIRRRKTLSRVVFLSAASARLALVRDPYSLLLDGGLTLVLLYWFEQTIGGRPTEQPEAPDTAPSCGRSIVVVNAEINGLDR